LNTFLCNFETNATALAVTGEMKTLELTRCLEGAALQIIQSLSQEERLDYEAIKLALRQRFRCTEGYYRKQFKTDRTRPGESQKSLVDRITLYLRRWVEMSGLTELIVRHSYFLSQSREIQMFLKEAGTQNLKEMMARCQNYREAHNIHGDEQGRFDKRKQNQGADAKKYGPHGEKVHQNETNTKQTNAKLYTFNNSQSSGAGGQYKPKSGCFVCGGLNHKAFSCPQRSIPQDQNRMKQGK